MMKNNDLINCAKCVFFVPDEGIKGECKLNPPMMFFDSTQSYSPRWIFPEVILDNFCSHFKRK